MKSLYFRKLAYGLLLSAIGIFSVSANAQTTNVTVSGNNYSVTLSPLVSGASYYSTLSSQVIWGNQTLASGLATAVGTTLGTPNGIGFAGDGPYFAYTGNGGAGAISYCKYQISSVGCVNGPDFQGKYWALVSLLPPTPSGPTAEEIAAAAAALAAAQAAALTASTQQSVVNTAQALQGTYALQNSVLANSFTYDCTLFDKNNICVSGGGRNTAVQAANGLNNTSALLIAAYRPTPSVRIGAYADQNLSVNNGGSTVNLGNNTPLIGLFAAWSQRQDDTGTEVRGSIAYGQKDTTINRQVVGTSQAGTGSSTLNTQGAQVTAKYGFGLGQAFVVSPYAGVRYSQNNMGGYTEGTSAGVSAPLTFGAVNTNATTLLAGVGGSFRGIPKTNLFASAGIESDTNTAAGTVNGTSSTITGLTPVNFNANPVKNRPTATVGATYDVEKNQRLGVTGIYRQEAYQAVSTTTVMATYTVGF